MIELHGKYGEAKVFTDLVEQEALNQISTMLDQQFAENAHVRIMPDVHAGAGCTIGTTMKIADKVCPNLVGVDIGCGMHVTKFSPNGHDSLEFVKLDNALNGRGVDEPIVPSGFSIRSKMHPYAFRAYLSGLRCFYDIDHERARMSIGTLGGGNHFIEIDVNPENGDMYLVVHSGSRHLGTEVAKYYQNKAAKRLSGLPEYERVRIIEELKSSGRQTEIPEALKDLKKQYPVIPKDLAYCEGELLDDYIHDMKLTQQFASWNRQAIADTILQYMGWKVLDWFETVHNYIDTRNMILRKGAVSAAKNERLLIPMNMRDGSLLCVGKGNPEWNKSAPHGAGRLMSRSKAKSELSMESFKDEMREVYTTSVCKSTLDESPMAYKPMQSIVDNIQDTVEIKAILKPVYNFKANN